ncbi:sulfate thiol esterase SoxB [Panacagrimonas perspica]|uniref:Sulfate thiol esterase SoxB n=1 Tax=Panacagrimonas perspica TaxID=381431 RepID=A0A4V3URB2_9GAMM|nr:thiosulfohydrolase SoxB [Panacagrimonas perspica]TDU26510.1 sulfate thiol esterase SoxB [Panacagrimonas perspica]THD02121.1 thiosulfohydrolase SoxB [Panacagrimonas perspica]
MSGTFSRREFLQVMAAAVVSGLPITNSRAGTDASWDGLYDVPRFGQVHLLHFTDCHAQLNPILFREPSVNLGVGEARNRPPHLVGDALLRSYGIKKGSPEAYALSCLDFEEASARFGRVGGFAHLSSLVKRMKATRPGALLLDGGDTWQGSATAMWTQGQDMVDACRLMGVDVMTGHWEFTLGSDRVEKIISSDFNNALDFVAHNVRTQDFGDPVFPPYVIRQINGVPTAVIGQAFPYTPIANPAHFTPNWAFGIQEENLQKVVTEARKQGAVVVVLLSHNGMDVDLKLASRVSGIDAILGGHTHDAVARPIEVKNAGGVTLVTNAGSNGKFLGVLDFSVANGRPTGWKYRLLPVFADAITPDPEMAALIARVRAPFAEKLGQRLAVAGETLYRRGNFNGTFDQVVLDALLTEKNAEIAFSPGFRWGTSLTAGMAITLEDVMNQTAISYPQTTLTDMTGERVKAVLEDVADNLFNPDPYLQQGGDMVRVGGLSYAIAPFEKVGNRIQDLRLNGKRLDATKTYKVAGWAPVAANVEGEPIWEVVSRWLKDQKEVVARGAQSPRLIGVTDNAGLL